MAKKGVLDALPEARRITIMHEQDGKHFVESRQDCDHIVQAASILSEQAPGKDFRLAALIPEAVLNQAMLEGWFHDKDKWKQWANDPNNAQLRVWKGRL